MKGTVSQCQCTNTPDQSICFLEIVDQSGDMGKTLIESASLKDRSRHSCHSESNDYKVYFDNNQYEPK